MPLSITLKFIGALRHALGKAKVTLNIEGMLSLKELINKLILEMPTLNQGLDPQRLEELQLNVLILVNGKEISVLNGFETMLQNGDEIVFVPIIHGG